MLVTLDSGSTVSSGTSSAGGATTDGPPDGRGGSSQSGKQTAAITSVSWAPSCGRSYHLIATGSRDGHVRIWKVKPGSDELDDGLEDVEDAKWTPHSVMDYDSHRSVNTAERIGSG